MSPQDPQTAALLAHVVSQIEQNVEFLASQNYISQADASAILTKLPNSNQATNHSAGPIASLAGRISNLGINRTPSAARAVPPPPPPSRALPQAKALWAYSSNDAEDLSFAPGDIIEIVEETNADWWTGRVNGKQGLFPSTYVEKLPEVQLPTPNATPAPTKAYKPFGAAMHGTNMPPPPGQGVNSVGLQEKPGTEAKKDKYGQYKNTLAHSAVGGVGFGAGSAIGGGLVRAIF
ncbi:Unconventional myosin-Ie [Psilocybe cubensis]|uniref:SH3 domain-containing protein n=2 Tax=Psilocybe cubensis TaxID=181762 RepID=A0A8H8CM59_PSICU|nr:Unconventional myosin-Ie [Psilocybe cubensis]KAH9481730.1 Unconventional myosin-Ie [Psilocybe cubensis]